jgi:hypothetical protein
MAVTLSVGLQKKVGLPDYGSFGASCHVEFEIDRSLIDHDMEGFQRKVASAFAACRQAVNDQLLQPSGHLPSNGNGHIYSNSVRQKAGRATQSQVRAIFAIARQQKFDPAIVVHERFNVARPEELSIREASTLIDELKTAQLAVTS